VSKGEFVEPFPSWTNVKTAYNAQGNGVADNTTAMQSALGVVRTSGNSSVVYFPLRHRE